MRCERCHDPSGSDRLTHAAHVLLGSGDIRKAETAEDDRVRRPVTRSIAACERRCAAVDDRECATCHTFSTLATHPEFAAVRAQATAGVGLKFNHDRHIIEAQTTRGAACQVCHEPTGDRTGFVPMTFDRHCASCHVPDGRVRRHRSDSRRAARAAGRRCRSRGGRARAATVAGRAAASRSRRSCGTATAGCSSTRCGSAHSIDRDGEAAERLTLRGQIAYLEQLSRVRPVHQATADELQAAATALQTEIADARRDGLARQASPDTDAIQGDLTTTARALAEQLGGRRCDGRAPTRRDARAAGPAATSTPPAADDDAQARFERRKAELLKVLDTVAARTPPTDIQERTPRAARADRKLGARRRPSGAGSGRCSNGSRPWTTCCRRSGRFPIPASSRRWRRSKCCAPTVSSASALACRPTISKPARPSCSAARCDRTARRTAVASARGPAAPARARAPARHRSATAISPRNRRLRQKQLDRVRLELELAQAPDESRAAAGAGRCASIPRRSRSCCSGCARSSTDLERTPRMSAAQSAEDREQRRNELDALLSRCLKCHEYDPSGVAAGAGARRGAGDAALDLQSRAAHDADAVRDLPRLDAGRASWRPTSTCRASRTARRATRRRGARPTARPATSITRARRRSSWR